MILVCTSALMNSAALVLYNDTDKTLVFGPAGLQCISDA